MKKTAATLVVLSFCILFIGSSFCIAGYYDGQTHFSFKTPDWDRYVNCRLDFDAIALNDSTNVIAFDSASTNASLCFSYPKDSSEIVKNRTQKKYGIKSYFDNDEPFQFSLKLPLNKKSIDDVSKRLISNASTSKTEYNKVVEVKYIKSEPKHAVFMVKCMYNLKARVASAPKISKPVSGSFTFLVRTSKK